MEKRRQKPKQGKFQGEWKERNWREAFWRVLPKRGTKRWVDGGGSRRAWKLRKLLSPFWLDAPPLGSHPCLCVSTSPNRLGAPESRTCTSASLSQGSSSVSSIIALSQCLPNWTEYRREHSQIDLQRSESSWWEEEGIFSKSSDWNSKEALNSGTCFGSRRGDFMPVANKR